MAEEAARAAAPASVSKMIGVGGELAGQTAEDLDRAIDLLKEYLTEDRLERMQEVLDQRTGSATVVFENPANPNNVSLSPPRICARLYDSFGLLVVVIACLVTCGDYLNVFSRCRTAFMLSCLVSLIFMFIHEERLCSTASLFRWQHARYFELTTSRRATLYEVYNSCLQVALHIPSQRAASHTHRLRPVCRTPAALYIPGYVIVQATCQVHTCW